MTFKVLFSLIIDHEITNDLNPYINQHTPDQRVLKSQPRNVKNLHTAVNFY